MGEVARDPWGDPEDQGDFEVEEHDISEMPDMLRQRALETASQHETELPYSHSMENARQDAIRGVSDRLFGDITSDTQNLERKIDAKDTVDIVNATLYTFQARGLIREKIGITPPDVKNIVDNAIEFFEASEIIDKKEN